MNTTERQERMSLHILKLHNRVAMAISFQKFRERRMQVLWLNRVKDLKSNCEDLKIQCEEQQESGSLANGTIEFLDHLLQYTLCKDSELQPQMNFNYPECGESPAGQALRERLSQLLSLIVKMKRKESSLQKRLQDFGFGNHLQDQVTSLEQMLVSDRKSLESLYTQSKPSERCITKNCRIWWIKT